MSPDDKRLVEDWSAHRNAESVEQLIRKYGALVYHAALRVTHDHPEAEDVAQECFIALIEHPPTSAAPLGAWLHRVATHRAIDRRRSESKRKDREQSWSKSQHSTEQNAAILWSEIQSRIDEAITALPNEERYAVVSHYLEGKTHEQIAHESSVSRPAITQRIHRGLDRLRDKLGGESVAFSTGALEAALLNAHSAPSVEAYYKLTQDGSKLRRALSDAGTNGKQPIRVEGVTRGRSWFRSAAWATGITAALVATMAYIGSQFRPTPGTELAVVDVAPAAERVRVLEAETIVAEPTEASIPREAPTEPLVEARSAPDLGAGSQQIIGRVFDGTTKAGVPGARINVYKHSSSSIGMLSSQAMVPSTSIHNASTNDSGEFMIDGLAGGAYMLVLETLPNYPSTQDGRASRRVRLDAESDPLHIDFAVFKGGTLSGRLLLNGEPLANTSVVLDSAPNLLFESIESDALGRYQIEGIPPYDGSVRSRLSVYGTLRATPYIYLSIEDGKTTDLDFDFLAGTSSISGNLYYHRKNGSVEATPGKMVVTYRYVDGEIYNLENLDIRSDENGHFFIEGLWGGEITLGVYPSIDGVHRHRHKIDLAEGAAVAHDFHFYETQIKVSVKEMPPNTGLDYWLVALAGELEIPELSVVERRAFIDANQLCVGWLRSNPEGGASGTLGGLPPGEYQVFAGGVPSGSHSLQDHAAGMDYYTRLQRTGIRSVTLPESTGEATLELSFDSNL